MMKRTGATAILVLSTAVMIFWFFEIDYKDLGFNHNRSAYLGIITMLLLMFNMILIKRKQKK